MVQPENKKEGDELFLNSILCSVFTTRVLVWEHCKWFKNKMKNFGFFYKKFRKFSIFVEFWSKISIFPKLCQNFKLS